jgi:hypothetical protein
MKQVQFMVDLMFGRPSFESWLPGSESAKNGNKFGWLVGQSVGRSVGWLVGQSVDRLVGRSVGWSVGQSVGQLVGQLGRRSVGPSVRRSVGPSVRRSVGPLVRQSVNRSVRPSFGLRLTGSECAKNGMEFVKSVQALSRPIAICTCLSGHPLSGLEWP